MGKMRRTAGLLLRLYRHPKTPFISKLLPWLALLYLIMPIDLLPDPAPLLGMIDDIAVILAFVAAAVRFVPGGVRSEVEKRFKGEHEQAEAQ